MDVLKHLHSSIAQTFEHTFDNAYRDLNAELSLRDARVDEAERKAKLAWEERNRMYIETLNMKEELRRYNVGSEDAELYEKTEQLEEAYAPQHVLKHHVNSDSSEAAKALRALGHTYAALYSEVQTLAQASGELRKQVKRHKKKLVHWRKSLDREEFTLVLDGVAVTFKRLEMKMPRLPTKSGPFATERLERARSPIHMNLDDLPTRPNNIIKDGYQNDLLSDHLEAASTQSNELNDPSGNEGNNSPEHIPEANFSRLKRKRVAFLQPSTPTAITEEGRPEQHVTIKNEDADSNTLQALPHHYGPSGTQDLDCVGSTVETPTKKKLRKSHWDHLTSPMGTTESQSKFADRRGPQPTVLQPVDGNLQTHERFNRRSEITSNKGSGYSDKNLNLVAEDGEENHRKPYAKIGRKEVSEKTSNMVQERLQDLLETPSFQRRPLNQQKIYKMPNQTTSSFSQTPQRSEKQSDGLEPAYEPYRARPLHRLKPDHFRINPNYNHGLDFAYDTVLRKKDERRCVNGCTRSNCCGDKFLAMARVGGLPGSSDARQKEEQKFLEEYLGEEKHLLDDISDEKRRALFEEAAARTFSNRYGKHRQQHQRATTPPGFWRTDMPNTQELDHDREEARLLEREKVKDRHREALRPEGMWKFADE